MVGKAECIYYLDEAQSECDIGGNGGWGGGK